LSEEACFSQSVAVAFHRARLDKTKGEGIKCWEFGSIYEWEFSI